MYKLIQSVDPTTKQVPIKKCFAKLTLSSKKKNNKRGGDQDTSTSTAVLAPVNTKCFYKENVKNSTENIKDNLLLRSISSDMDQFDFMEKLHFSDDAEEEENKFNQRSHAIGDRSEVNNVDNSVDANVKVKQDNTNLHENDVVISKNMPQLIVGENKYSGKCSAYKNEDDTREEIDYSDSDVSAITISSSSEVPELCTPLKDRVGSECGIAISSLVMSGETPNVELPCTLSNNRVERILEFLKDVSQDCKDISNYIDNDANVDESIPKNLPKNATAAEINGAKLKTKLTYADTESITTLSMAFDELINHNNEFNINNDFVCDKNDSTHTKDFAKRNGLKLNDTTLDMTEMQLSFFSHSSRNENLLTKKSFIKRSPVNNTFRCGILDDTEDNTHSDNDHDCTIPETASECSASSSATSEIFEENDLRDNNSEINVNRNDNDNDNDYENECGNNEIEGQSIVENSDNHIAKGRINISAKINIKIKFSQLESAAREMTNGNDSDANSHHQDFIDTLTDGEYRKQNHCNKSEKVLKNGRNDANNAVIAENSDYSNVDVAACTSRDVGDGGFISGAEKLLNQLYGQSWQTPEVLKSFKKTTFQKNSVKTTTDNFWTVTKATTAVETFNQSDLGDFSEFQHNMNRNLNSTHVTSRKHINNFASPMQKPLRSTNTNLLIATNGMRTPPPTTNDKRTSPLPTIAKHNMRQQEGSKSRRQQRDGRCQHLVNDYDVGDTIANDNSLYNCASDDIDINAISKGDADDTWSGESDDSVYVAPGSKESKTTITTATTKAMHKMPSSVRTCNKNNKMNSHCNNYNLVYLDLTKAEVSVMEFGTPQRSPAANCDSDFKHRLADLLRTCTAKTKSQMPSALAAATPTQPTSPCKKTKRKLFTCDFGDDTQTKTPNSLQQQHSESSKSHKCNNSENEEFLIDDYSDAGNHKNFNEWNFQILDKRVQALKGDSCVVNQPIFAITPLKSQKQSSISRSNLKNSEEKLLVKRRTRKDDCETDFKAKMLALQQPIENKYGFLKSLDVCVSKYLCHTDALVYRENYRAKKEELARLLYELFNAKLFAGRLNVPLVWNKKLCNTAGRCLNKKKTGVRSSVVELSEKVLTSADRLRCTLVHELCHAATWIFNGESGHGSIWKAWAQKAMATFPELPKIGVCHQYDIEYKYTYKCTLCNAKSHAHSKSRKIENIRCSYCHGAIEIFLNKKDKEGNIIPTPVREPTGFAKFVKNNYKQFKAGDMKHSDVMKQLSQQFAAIKLVTDNK